MVSGMLMSKNPHCTLISFSERLLISNSMPSITQQNKEIIFNYRVYFLCIVTNSRE